MNGKSGSVAGQLGHFKCVFDLDSQMPHRTHDFGVPQQQLCRAKILYATKELGCFVPAFLIFGR